MELQRAYDHFSCQKTTEKYVMGNGRNLLYDKQTVYKNFLCKLRKQHNLWGMFPMTLETQEKHDFFAYD